MEALPLQGKHYSNNNNKKKTHCRKESYSSISHVNKEQNILTNISELNLVIFGMLIHMTR